VFFYPVLLILASFISPGQWRWPVQTFHPLAVAMIVTVAAVELDCSDTTGSEHWLTDNCMESGKDGEGEDIGKIRWVV